MSGAAMTLEQIFEEAGLVAKWEARGEAGKATEIARNMLKDGFSLEQVARLSGLRPEQVKALSDN